MTIYDIIIKTLQKKEEDDKFASLNKEYYIAILDLLFKKEVKDYDSCSSPRSYGK